MRRPAAGVGLALVALALVLAVRTARFESRQAEVEPVAAPPIDVDAVARRLAGALRFRTISTYDRSQMDADEFRRFQAYLAETYPRLHATLERETVSDLTLLYRWPGRDPSLPPVVLMAHQDVVPVAEERLADWTWPPFEGRIEDGFVWGRGALDDKGALVCLFEAVEGLLAEGFAPERGVWISLGHDEEVGGDDGALQVALLLKARGIRPALVLDEGGAVAQGVLPGIDEPLAAVGIAEKGSLSVELIVEATGGHSSVPPRHTAVGILSAAIVKLENEPMPARIEGTTELFFSHLGPELPLPVRVGLANLWLFGPVAKSVMAREPVTDAMLRTTTAATVVEGGVKANVLPIRARAVVNFRIHPEDRIETVLAHVRRTIDDDRIEIRVGEQGTPREPSAISSVESEGFDWLRRSIGEVFPGAIVLPNLVVGGTDARYFARVSDSVYRLLPVELDRGALALLHGTDERIAVDALGRGIHFYRRLLRNAAGPPAPPAAR